MNLERFSMENWNSMFNDVIEEKVYHHKHLLMKEMFANMELISKCEIGLSYAHTDIPLNIKYIVSIPWY